MASMVARACSSTSNQMSPVGTVPEKGSRNKRKFRADPPLADPAKSILSAQNECISYEFSADKFGNIPDNGNSSGCDMCSVKPDSSEALKLDLGLSCAVGSSEVVLNELNEEAEGTEEFPDADWSDLTESQLEELVLNNLDAILKSAIKKIVARGYNEEVATKAVLRSGVYYGSKDIVSNIVDNTLTFLSGANGPEVAPSQDHYFEDLQQMEKYILAELVCVLREVRPFFSTGDAMWCLLICDMNVAHACAMDSDSSNNLVVDSATNENSAPVEPQPGKGTKSVESNNIGPSKPIPVTCAHHTIPVTCGHCPHMVSLVPCRHSFHAESPEAPVTAGASNSKQKSSFLVNGFAPERKCPHSLFHSVGESFCSVGTSHSSASEGSRKVSGINRRECIHRHKSLHLEKHCRGHGSRGGCRARKLSGFGGLVLDKKLKSVVVSTGFNSKNGSLKINKSVSVDACRNSVNHGPSTNTGFPSASPFGSETVGAISTLPESNIQSSLQTVNVPPALPTADTELSLSLRAKSNPSPVPVSANSNVDAPNCNFSLVTSQTEKLAAELVPQDEKDEMILKLVPRVRELQNQLQEWTEWANQKVMQAARRLSKDKAELKTLRQEKEEVERLKKEKQSLEENTMKKLNEMENALCKASGQVERANAAVRRLVVENAALRREMEAAKLRAAESAASCQEVSKREKKTMMKFQSWEKQKMTFQEEHVAEKRKVAQLQQEIEQAKFFQNQLEARRKQEQKAKEDLLTQANSFRKEREQVEASGKSKEDMIKLKAENNLQKYKDDIQRLEKEISQLRLMTESSKIAALKRGVEESYASKLADFGSVMAPKESRITVSRFLADFQEYSESACVKRERECVMCLSEEMSVVFLPCAHQVVCTMCNDLHEKQGMKDCPSCRSPIQRRLCVRFARC